MQELLDDHSSNEQSQLSAQATLVAKSISSWQKIMGSTLIILGLFIAIFCASTMTRPSDPFGLFRELYYIMMAFIMAFSAMYVFMGYLLLKQSGAYALHLRSGNGTELDLAFKHNFHFWLTVGISIIVYFACVFILAFFGAAGSNQF